MIDRAFSQPRLQSSQSHFARVPQADIPRSVFNRSHQMKTTFNAGYIIPIYADEVLPGDSFKLRMTSFARLATPVVPVMDNLYADVHFFFVPNRLLWTNWERFNGAQDDPTDSTDFEVPQLVATTGGWTVETLGDYLGYPLGFTGLSTNAFYTRAYNLIWNNWYRDENLQNSVKVDLDDGTDAQADYQLLRRGKRRDYFTSCLPWTQKGTAVSLPLQSEAPVLGIGKANQTWATGPINVYETGETSTTAYASYQTIDDASADTRFDVQEDPNNTGYPYIRADLTQATGTTINALREAFQMQKLFERDARGGTRYIEILKAHFGVTSPDFRLQRPEFLGGGTTMIATSPIAQTSSTDNVTPQGNLAAMGVFSHSGIGFNKSFVEHGVILGLLSVRADQTYQQGLNRQYSRTTRYDYYWPSFAHLGEQAVLNKEIYYQGTNADDDVFGYQERFAEYRYKPSQITGKFRSTYAQSLDVWHLAEEFGTLPQLDATFIETLPPMSRIKAVTSEPDFLLDVVFDLVCARPMPVYSVPGLIDHF